MNIIRCDRCATEISETTDAHLVTDGAWSVLMFQHVDTATQRHLCPPCSLSFRQFMEGPAVLAVQRVLAQPRPKP